MKPPVKKKHSVGKLFGYDLVLEGNGTDATLQRAIDCLGDNIYIYFNDDHDNHGHRKEFYEKITRK